MSDSRFNSVHLDALRREEFRKAREALLNAVGAQTLRADLLRQEASPAVSNNTAVIQGLAERLPASCDFILMDEHTIYPLKVGMNTIGRLADNDVSVPDPYLSRRHCAVLVHAADGCELHDLASKNGTFLNGQKISEPTPLKSGDEIRLSDRSFIFARRADLEDDFFGGATQRD